MPVGPQEATDYENADETKAFLLITDGVDNLLKQSYQGTGHVKVTFPAYKGYSQRVVDKLRSCYQQAGWLEVVISLEKNEIELQREHSESPPPELGDINAS